MDAFDDFDDFDVDALSEIETADDDDSERDTVAADVTEDYTPSPAPQQSRLINEQFFGVFALPSAKLGWSVMPQESRGQRLPVYVDDERIKWSLYQNEPADLDTVAHWKNQALDDNMALILGRASGNVFAIDSDVLDVDMSRAIQHIAYRTLGRTRFVRIGKFPKIMMFYRSASAEELPANRRYDLTEADGTAKSEHAIEVQSQGKMVTAFGLHHETGQRFQWTGGLSPATAGPDQVPLVTADQLEAFVEAVNEYRAIYRTAPRDLPDASGYVSSGSIRVPTLRSGNRSWTVDAAGLVADGREAYLFDLCSLTVRANPADSLTAPGRAEIARSIIETFNRQAKPKAKWNPTFVFNQAVEKVNRLSSALADGRIKPLSSAETAPLPEGVIALTAPSRSTVGYDLQSLIPGIRRLRSNLKAARPIAAAFDFDPASRSIPVDPANDSARVAGSLREALQTAYDRATGIGGPHQAELVRVPTGGGKTTAFISLIAATPRPVSVDGTELPLGVLFLTPTHKNIKEVHAKAKEASLNSVAYKGKLQDDDDGTPMCAQREKVRPLQEKGLSTSGMCMGFKKGADGQKIPDPCPHRSTCPFIAQQEKALHADLIVAPHAYLGLEERVPKPFKSARLVVVDESILGSLTHDKPMPIETLQIPRKAPPAGKMHEDHSTSEPELCMVDLERLRAVAIEALMNGRDIAAAILAVEHAGVSNSPVDAAHAVERCLHVCASAMRAEYMINPHMTVADAERLAAQIDDRSIRSEYRFWKLVQSRLEDITAGVAYGEADRRIRRIKQVVQMSWRSPMALSDKPSIFLDATANEAVLTKLVGKPVIAQIIDAPIRQATVLVPDATYSKSWLLGRHGEDAEAHKMKAQRLAKVVRSIHTICMRHSHGIVAIAVPKALRAVLEAHGGWPRNMIWMHYGAVRGLDYAKDVVALVTCGELNARPEQIDGLVAALTYDDPEPESPMVGPDGKPPAFSAEPVRSPMRDGRDLEVDTYRVGGHWASMIQAAIRDEDLQQVWGRPRPIHRSTPAVIYHLGRTVPAGTVIDDVCSMKELVGADADVALLLGEAGGVLRESVASTKAATAYAFDAICQAVEAGGAMAAGLTVTRNGDGERALVAKFSGLGVNGAYDGFGLAPDLIAALRDGAVTAPAVDATGQRAHEGLTLKDGKFVNADGVELGADAVAAALYDRVVVLPELPQEDENPEVAVPSIAPTDADVMKPVSLETYLDRMYASEPAEEEDGPRMY